MPSEIDREAAKVLTILSIADLAAVQAEDHRWFSSTPAQQQHLRTAGGHAEGPAGKQLHRFRRAGR